MSSILDSLLSGDFIADAILHFPASRDFAIAQHSALLLNASLNRQGKRAPFQYTNMLIWTPEREDIFCDYRSSVENYLQDTRHFIHE